PLPGAEGPRQRARLPERGGPDVRAFEIISDSGFFFFFKQKTAYELGLGIPAEPLFRSNSRERSGINTILHELNPLFTINVTMRDIKSKNVYSRVNSKATTQWRKTESANGVHLEGVASDNRSS